MKKSKPRKAEFRAHTEARLAAMGFPRSRYEWQSSPARLLMIVGDELRIFHINSGRREADNAFELGRLATWAEVLRLAPVSLTRVPAEKTQLVQRDQLDLIVAIDADKRKLVAHSGVAK